MLFQEAVDRLTERCPSVALTARRNPRSHTAGSRHYPFGLYVPKPMSVEQSKPYSTTPLQAWKGYHGNVYFEPIKVNPVRCSVSPLKTEPELEKYSDTLQQILKSKKRTSPSRNRSTIQSRGASSLTGARSGSVDGRRQMAVLDKATVFEQGNGRIQEDVIWIIGRESTGSLCVDTSPPSTHAQGAKKALSDRARKASEERDKIYKGSVTRNVRSSGNDRSPCLALTGGRFRQFPVVSPLQRSHTVLPLCESGRATNNTRNPTPDIDHSFTMDTLPPLGSLKLGTHYERNQQTAAAVTLNDSTTDKQQPTF